MTTSLNPRAAAMLAGLTMMVAACGNPPSIDPPPGQMPIAHVSVHNASNEDVLVRLAWPDGLVVVYEVEAGGWAMTTQTIGVSGYPLPIEVLDTDCSSIGRVTGLGPVHMLVTVRADRSLDIGPVEILPDGTRVATGILACGGNYPPPPGSDP